MRQLFIDRVPTVDQRVFRAQYLYLASELRDAGVR